MRVWISKLIKEQLEPAVNEKFKAVLSQLSSEANALDARRRSSISRLPSKADFEWLQHELEELRWSNDDLKNQMRARETFDWEVETRLMKLEK